MPPKAAVKMTKFGSKPQKPKSVFSLKQGGLIKKKVQEVKEAFMLRGAIRPI